MMEMVDKVLFRLSHLGQRNGNRAPDPSGLLLTLISDTLQMGFVSLTRVINNYQFVGFRNDVLLLG